MIKKQLTFDGLRTLLHAVDSNIETVEKKVLLYPDCECDELRAKLEEAEKKVEELEAENRALNTQNTHLMTQLCDRR